jgi:predicted ribosome quality control (RQC) complex YloA/Tae2 family protein
MDLQISAEAPLDSEAFTPETL